MSNSLNGIRIKSFTASLAALAVLALLAVPFRPSSVLATDIFVGDFETSFASQGWSKSPPGAKWNEDGNFGYNSNKSAIASGNTGSNEHMLSKMISTAGYFDVTLSFAYAACALETGDYVNAQYTTDGGSTWTTLLTIDDSLDTEVGVNDSEGNCQNAVTWTNTTFALPSSADDNAGFGVRFAMKSNANSGDYVWIDDANVKSPDEPTPTPTPSGSPTPTPSDTPTPTPTPSDTPTPTPTPSDTPTPTPTPSDTPTPTPSDTPTPTPTPSDTPTPTPTPSDTPTPTPSPSDTPTPTPTPSDTPTPTPTPSDTPTPTPQCDENCDNDPTPTPTPTPTPSNTPTPTPSRHGGGGGGSYVSPTPTPTPEQQEILGASTQTLPVTGAGFGDIMGLVSYALMIPGGAALVLKDRLQSRKSR